MRAVLYTDLNCPFCYATERRLEALGAHDLVDWHGVEHEPDLPVPMLTGDEDLTAELTEEVTAVRARAPEVEIALPLGKPNTALAVRAAAAAERIDPGRGRAFRNAVYRAFWTGGADISSRELLDELAREHGLAALAIRPEDDLRVASWRLDWERSPLRGVPLLVRDDGESLYGLKELDTLERFIWAR
jgi:predicted DsbA family dithiol-disulfide isomerase